MERRETAQLAMLGTLEWLTTEMMPFVRLGSNFAPAAPYQVYNSTTIFPQFKDYIDMYNHNQVSVI